MTSHSYFRNKFIKKQSNGYEFNFNENIDNWDNSINKNNEEFNNYKLEDDLSFCNFLLNDINDKLYNIEKQHSFLHITKIQKINNWELKTGYDSVNKPFLRFTLKKNSTDLDIKKLLNILLDCSITYEIGGNSIIKIEKLLFNFLICKKLNNPINKFDVKEFFKFYTDDEIKAMKIVKKNKNIIVSTQKYNFFENKEAIYIDIPLLFDFYLHNIGAMPKVLFHHRIDYNLFVPENKLELINKYVDNVVLMFDECIVLNNKPKINMYEYEFLIMQSNYHFFEKINNNIIKFKTDKYLSKFFFIIVRNEELLDNNEIYNVTQFPQITKIEIRKYNYDKYKNEITNHLITDNVDLSNVWFLQYDNIIIYAVASNCVSNMNNWIRVHKESSESIENLNFSKKYNNYEENFYVEYKVYDIAVHFSNSNINVNVEIVEISQNLLRMMCGMAGTCF
jgi:hypothetical protein